MFRSRRATLPGSSGNRREAQPEPERCEQPIQRLLSRVVARMDRPLEIGTGHPDVCGELLDSLRPDHLAQCLLECHALLDRCDQETAREGRIPEIPPQTLVPVPPSPCH